MELFDRKSEFSLSAEKFKIWLIETNQFNYLLEIAGLSEPSLNAQYQQNLSQITSMFEFSAWTHYLCEYLLLPQCYYLKRLIKKLLQILCGSKDKYRKFKDHHILITSMRSLVSLCPLGSSPPAPPSMLSMGSNINSATESLSVISEAETKQRCVIAYFFLIQLHYRIFLFYPITLPIKSIS